MVVEEGDLSRSRVTSCIWRFSILLSNKKGGAVYISMEPVVFPFCQYWYWYIYICTQQTVIYIYTRNHVFVCVLLTYWWLLFSWSCSKKDSPFFWLSDGMLTDVFFLALLFPLPRFPTILWNFDLLQRAFLWMTKWRWLLCPLAKMIKMYVVSRRFLASRLMWPCILCRDLMANNKFAQLVLLDIYMYICLHVHYYICIHVYLYICIHVYLYIYMCVYVYICICICIYIYIHVLLTLEPCLRTTLVWLETTHDFFEDLGGRHGSQVQHKYLKYHIYIISYIRCNYMLRWSIVHTNIYIYIRKMYISFTYIRSIAYM